MTTRLEFRYVIEIEREGRPVTRSESARLQSGLGKVIGMLVTDALGAEAVPVKSSLGVIERARA
jgi:hypothetical protein